MKLRTLLAAILLAGCSGGGSSPAPAPISPFRIGVPPIYFGATDASAGPIAAETGTIWSNGWGSKQFHEVVVDQLRTAQQFGATFAVVAVDLVMEPDGQEKARLRLLFDALRAAGLLSMVKWLFLIDEPEQKGYTAADIARARATVLEVAAEYGELAGAKIVINWGCGNPFVGVESADIGACDRYDRSAAETHANLKEKMQGKPFFQFAGGVEPFFNDPFPFVNEAMADPQEAAVGFFIYHDNAATGLGKGIGNLLNPQHANYVCASAYLRTGRKNC